MPHIMQAFVWRNAGDAILARLDKHMQIIYKKDLRLEEAIIIPSHALHGEIHF